MLTPELRKRLEEEGLEVIIAGMLPADPDVEPWEVALARGPERRVSPWFQRFEDLARWFEVKLW